MIQNSKKSPRLSVLISTFNRPKLLKRAMNSVLQQTYQNFELVIINDNSAPETESVIDSFGDPRIVHIKNKTNVGAEYGDRAHMRRFVYEIMKGEFFLYLCDDDYLLSKTLFQRQIVAHDIYGTLSMVIGGQLSHFVTTEESLFGGTYEEPKFFELDHIAPYFDLATLKTKTPHLYFHGSNEETGSLYSNYYLPADAYLREFASAPAAKNIIVGATMFSRDKFILAGGFLDKTGSKWQAGYELLMGPGCVGDVVYLNEPAILVDVRPMNASFQRTQLDHYLDSIVSLKKAFEVPLKLKNLKVKKSTARKVKALASINLSRAFLSNTLTIYRHGSLSLCSEENIATPVKGKDALKQIVACGGLFHLTLRDWALMALAQMPSLLTSKLAKKLGLEFAV